MSDTRNLLLFEEFPDSSDNAAAAEEASSAASDASESSSSVEEGVEETEAESESEEETAAPVPLVVEFPDDYLDTATFTEGVESILAVVAPSAPEEEIVLHSFDARAASPLFPQTATYLQYGDQQILFPSSYGDDLYLLADELYNAGASVTVGMDLRSSASVSRYVISEVTIPTYNSSAYWQYLNSYGAPYRIVDRYINSNGSYTSTTRSSSQALDFSNASLSSYRGFGQVDLTFLLIGMVILVLLLISRFRRIS